MAVRPVVIVCFLLLPAAALAQAGGGGDVTLPAVIPTGDLASQALTWMVTTFGTVVGTALTALILRLLKKAGIQANAMLRAQLQDIVVNGLNVGAEAATKELAGRGRVEIKSAAVQKTVEYVKAHGADTMKALGIDPTTPEAVEAIKARIETAIADPATPTAPVLDAPQVGANARPDQSQKPTKP